MNQLFKEYTKEKGYRHFFCPGRVNLIGEHIDYNGGHVLPCALEFGIYGAAKRNDEEKLILKSKNMELEVEVNLDDLEYDEAHDWANYPKGVIKEFIDRGYSVGGMEINYWGNIPNGAGLSSSAAIEILTCIIVNNLYELNVDKLDWVKLSQKVENEYIGVNCGIMDQFSVAFGKKDYGILLDCNTLDYRYAEVDVKGYSLVIINSNKRRSLSSSEYNKRRRECEEGLKILQKYEDIEYLCDLTSEKLSKYIDKIEKENIKKRVRHAVTENERSKKTLEALNNRDFNTFSRLMNESHDSLKYDYEVTGFELDTLVEEARKCPGVLCSRMTGAGFGGSTVTFIKNEYIDEFEKHIKKVYKEKTGLEADFYYPSIEDGVKEI